jgi:phosphotransacetylase
LNLIKKIKVRARALPQRIVLPASEDPRVVSRGSPVAREFFVKIRLLGRNRIIDSVAADLHVPLVGVAIEKSTASKDWE